MNVGINAEKQNQVFVKYTKKSIFVCDVYEWNDKSGADQAVYP
jgi:hypothetical protein